MIQDIQIHGMSIPVDVRRSDKARRLSMRMDTDLVLRVTVPRRCSERRVSEFLEDQRRWVFKAYTQLHRKKRKSFSLSFGHGDSIPFLGEWYTLEVLPGSSGSVEVLDDVIRVWASQGNSKLVRSKLLRFYRAKAREVISESVAYYARLLGLQYANITIRDQKTRWGSCSSNGNLNFSYRLVMTPIKILEYVVVHELCHLVHMNHSKKFWGLVSTVIPDYKERRNWLKDTGVLIEQ